MRRFCIFFVKHAVSYPSYSGFWRTVFTARWDLSPDSENTTGDGCAANRLNVTYLAGAMDTFRQSVVIIIVSLFSILRRVANVIALGFCFLTIFLIVLSCVCFAVAMLAGGLSLKKVCGEKVCAEYHVCSDHDSLCYPCISYCNETSHNFDAKICEKQCQGKCRIVLSMRATVECFLYAQGRRHASILSRKKKTRPVKRIRA